MSAYDVKKENSLNAELRRKKAVEKFREDFANGKEMIGICAYKPKNEIDFLVTHLLEPFRLIRLNYKETDEYYIKVKNLLNINDSKMKYLTHGHFNQFSLDEVIQYLEILSTVD